MIYLQQPIGLQNFIGDYAMTKYIMRLDDACEKRNIESWDRMEKILDKYNVKPLVGVIPNCEDPCMNKYEKDDNYITRLNDWKNKDWEIAMHGYNHVYSNKSGGLNPVNHRSEFAGENLDKQKDKIKKGILKLNQLGITPKVFFAPSHTFDKNTLLALKQESNIRIISDTIAYDSYNKYGFTFVPQQSGKVRSLPFKKVTFCYHPNTMSDNDFLELEKFLQINSSKFISFPASIVSRKLSLIDKCLNKIYFFRRR